MSIYYVPDTLLSTLLSCNYILLIRTPKGKYYYTHFADEESEAWKGQVTSQNDSSRKARLKTGKYDARAFALNHYYTASILPLLALNTAP